jgi:hypothetical protein
LNRKQLAKRFHYTNLRSRLAVLNMQESRSEPMVARRKSLRPSLLAFRLLESLEFSLWLLDHRTG